MKRTKLKELLVMVRQYIIDDYCQTGICDAIANLGFNHEWDKHRLIYLKQYIVDNKPNLSNEYKEFTDNHYWINNLYWWTPICKAPETKQNRIDYLTKLIDNIKII